MVNREYFRDLFWVKGSCYIISKRDIDIFCAIFTQCYLGFVNLTSVDLVSAELFTTFYPYFTQFLDDIRMVLFCFYIWKTK